MTTTPVKERSARSRVRRFSELAAGAASLAMFGVVCGTPAQAQSIDYGSLEQLFQGPVTTSATGSPQRAEDVPVNMTIITADDIRRSGARDIPGVLRLVGCVDVMQWGSDNSDVSIRGYDQAYAARTLVLIDGRQVYADYYGVIPWSALPVELSAIRQIEVVKGPNSALFGFNATGGVINIITYNPRYDDVNVALARVGTQGLGELSAVATLRLGSASSFRLSGGYRKDNDFSTPIPPPLMAAPRKGNDRAEVDADAVIALGGGVELGLEASHSHVAQNEVLPDYILQPSRYETNSLEGRLSADTHVGLLRLEAYSNWIKWEGAPIPGLPEIDVDNQVTVVQADDVFNLGADHTVRLALGYRHNTVNTIPFAGGTVAYDVLSASGMWDWQIVSAISLTNAVRLDRLTLNRSGAYPPGYPFTNADWDRTLDELSFNSGLVWAANDEDTFRLIVSRGVQLPSLVESGALLIATPFLQVTGIPNLKPTSVTNYEISWDRKLPALDAKLQISVFHQDTQDVISVGGGYAMGSYGPYGTPANIGSSRADGISFTARGRLDGQWRWTISYRFESVDDHFQPIAAGGTDFVDYEHTTPKHVVKAGLGWADGPWEADAHINYQSDTTGLTSVGGIETELTPVGSFASVGGRAAYQITDWASLAVSGENLLQPQQRQTSGPDVEREVFLTLTLRG
jgi:outer membrane cobalamin receptor